MASSYLETLVYEKNSLQQDIKIFFWLCWVSFSPGIPDVELG